MAAKLVAEEGTLKGLVLSLEDGDQWVIGRDPDACQLLVEDPSTSRKHLICRTTPEGILVENLSTTNPTQINNEEVTEPRLLQNGDAVRIGDGIFRFYAEAAAHLFKENSQQEAPSLLEENEVLEKNGEPQENINKQDEKPQEETTPEEVIPQEVTPEEPNETSKEENPPIEEKASEEVNRENTDIPADDQALNTDEPTESVPEVTPEAVSEPKVIDEPITAEVINEEEFNEEVINEEVNEQPAEGPKETAEPPVEENQPAENIPDQKDKEEPYSEEPPMETSTVEKDPSQASSETPNTNPRHDEDRHDSIYDEDADQGGALAEINFGLLDTGRWLLKVIGGPNNGAEFSMQTNSSYVIGTDPNVCDIVFHDTSVSRQHARVTVSPDDSLLIEDLKSRNGTLVEGEPLTGKRTLPPNIIVNLGTTSFVVFDREGEMQTIISPLMPSIVKTLKEETKKADEAADPALAAAAAPMPEAVKPETHPTTTLGAFILIGILTGLFVIVGIGTSTLFKSEPVEVAQPVDAIEALDAALAPFPSVKYTFNKNTGQLLLVGHVLTSSDRSQLLYSLQGLRFIRSYDDSGIVIDEYVWREINQVMEKNPAWRGITVMAPSAGHFVVTGYLEKRSQAESLSEYLSANFPYPDLLDKRIIVDEEVVSNVNNILQSKGFRGVNVKLENGEVILTGAVAVGKSAEIEGVIPTIKEIRGVRGVRNNTTEQAADLSLVNISDKYEVTGISSHAGRLSVVINGRILMKGDILDGMLITSVQSNAVFLERGGTKYRIDFSR